MTKTRDLKMPLETGKSKSAFSHNVKAEVSAGKPVRQAVAIAYAQKRRGDADIEIDCEDEDVEMDCPAVDAAPKLLAYDKSLRTFDKNGFMHVPNCNISKANVCPYLGEEIPGAEALGLDPKKVYMLYRDADELAKAAPTFERMPLLMHHVGVSSDDPNKDMIIGTYSNVRWEAPYLKADLTVWDQRGIDAIENGTQEELSPGYHYRPVANSGIANGIPFEIRMVDIKANHLAIVSTGRTGPDVAVRE
jgi:hypothetical protein